MDRKALLDKLEKDRNKGAARFILIVTLSVLICITAINLITGRNEITLNSTLVNFALSLICGIAAWFANGNYIKRSKAKL